MLEKLNYGYDDGGDDDPRSDEEFAEEYQGYGDER